MSTRRIAAYLMWSAGLALFIGIIAFQGVAEVMSALALAGAGVLVVAAYHVAPFAADVVAWRGLFAPADRPRAGVLVWVRWVGESVNGLLPVAHVGGEFVRAHLLARRGVPGAIAGASVVVDMTIGAVSQIVFALIGVGLLMRVVGLGDAVAGVLIGMGVFSALIGAFYVVQRRGLFGFLTGVLSSFAGGRRWADLSGGAAALDGAIQAIYRRRGRVARVFAWRLAGWVLGAGEVWLALYFLGHPVSLVDALMLESLGQAVRAMAFAIPGALGVQEGGFILLGQVVGIGPDVSLALSLVKRIRELLLGVPGLLAWQAAEGRRLWRRRTGGEIRRP